MADRDFLSPKQQKRDSARAAVNIPGTYRLGSSQDWLPCHVIDLSIGGLQFEGKFSFYPGDKVDVKFFLVDKNIICKAEITNVSGRKAGAKFTSVLDSDIALVHDFVNKTVMKNH